MPATFFTALEAHPDRIAFTVEGEALTYGALDAHARRYAAYLYGLGLRRGDRIAVFADASPALLTAIVAHLRAGLVHVPINTRYRAREIAHILDDSGAAALWTSPDAPAADLGRARRDDPDAPLRALVGAADAMGGEAHEATTPPPWPSPPPAPDDLAMLIYTSGTTGRSKGVALTHGALTANIGATTGLWRWSAGDRLALALPLFHVHGLGLGVLGTLLHGMRADVFARFDPATIATACAAGATIFMGVPTMYRRLLDHLEADPDAAPALARARLFTSGSAALPASDFIRFEQHTGHRILERYGMSETGFTLSNPSAGERRPGTVGRAVPGYEVRIVDEAGRPVAGGELGEIQVRGDGLMRGYWRDPAATDAAFTEDGWFWTGDMATRDDDGYVRIVGRRSADIIKSGGFKIGAREIEDVIADDPDVAEVAVVGLPDPTWGERVVAAIVPSPAAPERSLEVWREALARCVGATLADYKKPRQVALVDAIPRNALGKVQKHVLKAQLTP